MEATGTSRQSSGVPVLLTRMMLPTVSTEMVKSRRVGVDPSSQPVVAASVRMRMVTRRLITLESPDRSEASR